MKYKLRCCVVWCQHWTHDFHLNAYHLEAPGGFIYKKEKKNYVGSESTPYND